MNQSSRREEPSGAQRLFDLGDKVAQRFNIVSGEIALTLNRRDVVGIEITSNAKFALTKNGDSGAPLLTPAARHILAPSPHDISQVRDDFHRRLVSLIYEYGTLVIEIKHGQVYRVRATASMLRQKDSLVLDILLGGGNGPGGSGNGVVTN